MNSLSNGNSHGEAHRAIGSTERRYSSLQSPIAPAEVLSQAVPAHLHLGAASDRIISRFTVKISRERCGPRSGYAQEPGLLPAQGILFVGGEPKVGKSLLVANLALS